MAESDLTSEKIIRRPAGPRFWLVVVAAIVTLGLGLWRVALWQWQQGLEEVAEEADHQLALRVGQLRGELKRFEVLPRLLANEKPVRRFLANRRDSELGLAINRYFEEANRISGAADTYLMDADGLTLAASNWNSDISFVGVNFSYRPYFKGAVESGRGQYFALGSTSARRGFYFAAPVKEGNAILGVIAVKVDVPNIEAGLESPKGEVLVTDSDGVIFMSSRPDWRYKSLVPLSPDVAERIHKSLRYPGVTHEPLPVVKRLQESEGASLVELGIPGPPKSFLKHSRFVVVDEGMPEAGWRVHLMLPVSPAETLVARTLLAAGVGLLVLLLLFLFLRQRWKRKRERLYFERAAQRTLEQSEKRIRGIIENTHAGLITVSDGALIDSINPTARRMFGIGRDKDCVGQPLSRLLAGMPTTLVGRTGKEAKEVTGRRADGSRFPVEIAVREAPVGEGNCMLVTLHDITERKKQETELRDARTRLEQRVSERTADLTATNLRLQTEIEDRVRAEEALRDTQDQLIQAAKLASLGQMSASISHELNQPLAAIRTYADNAHKLIGHDRAEDASWNLTQIGSLTDRVARISSQLKTFARKASGTLESVSVAEAVRVSVDIASAAVRKADVDLEVATISSDIRVWADRVQLEQVLLNLLTNGVQAVGESPQRQVRVEVREADGQVALSVIDSGPGIEPAHLDEIFDPFYTTKETGLGLGLSICQRLVESMNGMLTVSNGEEAGAVFTVTLPAVEEEANGITRVTG